MANVKVTKTKGKEEWTVYVANSDESVCASKLVYSMLDIEDTVEELIEENNIEK